jgi:hypothetical protein
LYARKNKAFIKSNKRDDIIEIKPNKKVIKTCLDRGLSTAENQGNRAQRSDDF